MIASLEDYFYWSYFAGDMPTDRIDGEIMPLRTAAHKGDLRGVDVAFLAENMASCDGCYESSTVRRWNGKGFAWERVHTLPSLEFELTKRLSGQQILDRIHTPLAANLNHGNLDIVQFWNGTTITDTELWRGGVRPGAAAISALMDTLPCHALHDAPSVAASAFASGFDQSAMEGLFSDARKLRHPVVYVGSLFDLFNPATDYRQTDEGGTPSPGPAFTGFRTDSQWDVSAGTDWSTVTWGANSVAFARLGFPFLMDDVKLFAVYDAVEERDGSAGVYYGGIKDLTPYLTKTSDRNSWTFGGAGDLMWRQLLLSICPIVHADATVRSKSNIVLDFSIYAIGTLNDRFKWW